MTFGHCGGKMVGYCQSHGPDEETISEKLSQLPIKIGVFSETVYQYSGAPISRILQKWLIYNTLEFNIAHTFHSHLPLSIFRVSHHLF